MVDATRGSLRIRAWPKKRPGPRHPTNEFWTMWLKAATYLYRYQPASVQWELQQATKGTVYMPRDLFISSARGRAFLLQDELGRKYYPMAFVQDVSDSLDAIGQFPGMMLFRGEHLWLPIQPGSPGNYLRYVTDNDPPEWIAATTGQYLIVPILIGHGTDEFINVNSATYIINSRRCFPIDYDQFPFNQYRLNVNGNSNAIGQTVACSFRALSAPTVPIGTTADDCIVTNAGGNFDSGWVDVTVPGVGTPRYGLAFKGSNATVDINLAQVTVQLRIV